MRKLLLSGAALAFAAFLSNSNAFAQDEKKPDAVRPETPAPGASIPSAAPAPQAVMKMRGLTRSLAQPADAGGKGSSDGATNDDPIGGLPGHGAKGSD